MTLDEIVHEASALEGASLAEKLAWFERAALTAEAADLGERGAEGALSLRAALGAIVKFSQGDQGPDALAELDVIVRTLFSRAMLAFCLALAEQYEALAAERGAGALRDACREVSEIYRELARALRRGEPVSAQVTARVRALQDVLERARAAPPPA